MKAQLVMAPEGTPNFCFAVYAADTDLELEFVQSDWDYPHLAARLGYVSCECGATDGTVDCAHKTASDMISEAYDYLAARDGKEFEWYE